MDQTDYHPIDQSANNIILQPHDDDYNLNFYAMESKSDRSLLRTKMEESARSLVPIEVSQVFDQSHE